jgi:hypothetical protein
MPNVKHICSEIQPYLEIYRTIRDCINGQKKVKDAGDLYLPRPNAYDTSNENLARYRAYLERAVFYNVTGRTLAGLTGEIYKREPVIEVPENMKAIVENADGAGINLTQLSKKSSGYVLAYGRSGIFIDYPRTEGSVSRAELEAGDIRPTINAYAPYEIVNWRTTTRGAKEILSLVVLKEKYINCDDGFEYKVGESYRVLRLGTVEDAMNGTEANGVYNVEIWRDRGKDMGVEEAYTPTGADGQPFREIPFIFIGSENNDQEIDKPPLYDMAVLNIAHYRNSADYEESSFIVGQPTPYFSGLTENWVSTVLKGEIQLGSRAAVPLPENGTAGLLQAKENIMPKEAMDHKEKQMLALGAKLVEQREIRRTATETVIQSASETSILTSSAKNVSEAYTRALEICQLFVGTSEGEVKFELNTEFQISSMSYQERLQLMQEWQAGLLAFPEAREALKKVGVATLDKEEAEKVIEEEKKKRAEMAPEPNLPGQDNRVNRDSGE